MTHIFASYKGCFASDKRWRSNCVQKIITKKEGINYINPPKAHLLSFLLLYAIIYMLLSRPDGPLTDTLILLAVSLDILNLFNIYWKLM